MTRGALARGLVLGAGLAFAFVSSACHKAADPDEAKEKPSAESASVPVRVQPVTRAPLSRIVSAPGQTNALTQEKVRAPFAGTLLELTVTDGDSVRKGQTVGAIVSRDTVDAEFAQNRQRFLAEQGYAYRITDAGDLATG